MKYPRAIAGATASLVMVGGLAACSSPEKGPELGPTPTIEATADIPDTVIPPEGVLDAPYFPQCDQELIENVFGSLKDGVYPPDTDPQEVIYDAILSMDNGIFALENSTPAEQQPNGRLDYLLSDGQGGFILVTEQNVALSGLTTLHLLRESDAGDECEVAGVSFGWSSAVPSSEGLITHINTTGPWPADLIVNEAGNFNNSDHSAVTLPEATEVAVTVNTVVGEAWRMLASSTSVPFPPSDGATYWV